MLMTDVHASRGKSTVVLYNGADTHMTCSPLEPPGHSGQVLAWLLAPPGEAETQRCSVDTGTQTHSLPEAHKCSVDGQRGSKVQRGQRGSKVQRGQGTQAHTVTEGACWSVMRQINVSSGGCSHQRGSFGDDNEVEQEKEKRRRVGKVRGRTYANL